MAPAPRTPIMQIEIYVVGGMGPICATAERAEATPAAAEVSRNERRSM